MLLYIGWLSLFHVKNILHTPGHATIGLNKRDLKEICMNHVAAFSPCPPLSDKAFRNIWESKHRCFAFFSDRHVKDYLELPMLEAGLIGWDQTLPGEEYGETVETAACICPEDLELFLFSAGDLGDESNSVSNTPLYAKGGVGLFAFHPSLICRLQLVILGLSVCLTGMLGKSPLRQYERFLRHLRPSI